MHGNVEEWCGDYYRPIKPEAAVDPLGSLRNERRVLRGGAWDIVPGGCLSAGSLEIASNSTCDLIGFRIVVEVPRTP
jgi:formylglycine-generating enzyme required for sulfatase activity